MEKHGKKSKKCLESVPQDILPIEYGGSAGNVKELHGIYLKIFLKIKSSYELFVN